MITTDDIAAWLDGASCRFEWESTTMYGNWIGTVGDPFHHVYTKCTIQVCKEWFAIHGRIVYGDEIDKYYFRHKIIKCEINGDRLHIQFDHGDGTIITEYWVKTKGTLQ